MILAIAVAIWFIAAGIADLAARPATGRRAVAPEPGASGGQLVARRIRGVLSILGGLAAAAGGAITVLGLRLPNPGFAAGVGLAALAAWSVADNVRLPIRAVRLAVAVLGFVLAVFSAGFRD